MKSKSIEEFVADEMECLALVDDMALWNVARTQIGADEQTRMQFLLGKQQSTGLSAPEMAEAENACRSIRSGDACAC